MKRLTRSRAECVPSLPALRVVEEHEAARGDAAVLPGEAALERRQGGHGRDRPTHERLQLGPGRVCQPRHLHAS